MAFLNEELIQYTQFTWDAILEVEVEQVNEEFEENSKTDVNACILISGAWKGMVVMTDHLKLAKAVAIKMFDLKEFNFSTLKRTNGENRSQSSPIYEDKQKK